MDAISACATIDFVRVRRNFFHDHVVRRDKQSENTQRFRYGSFEDIHWKVSEFLARRTRQNIIYPVSLPLSFYLRVFYPTSLRSAKTNFIIVFSLPHQTVQNPKISDKNKNDQKIVLVRRTHVKIPTIRCAKIVKSRHPKTFHFSSPASLSSRALIVFHSSFDNASNFVLPAQTTGDRREFNEEIMITNDTIMAAFYLSSFPEVIVLLKLRKL